MNIFSYLHSPPHPIPLHLKNNEGQKLVKGVRGLLFFFLINSLSKKNILNITIDIFNYTTGTEFKTLKTTKFAQKVKFCSPFFISYAYLLSLGSKSFTEVITANLHSLKCRHVFTPM